LRGALVLCALLSAVASPRSAQGNDGAADKATARTLATEGIDLFNEGRFAEALDRLERAQALFDAPIHLLYIARAQTRLGDLVEATETYRRLIRVELTAETPAAVREAVEAGDTELDSVDARVAKLRIDVVPSDESGLVLVIDGETVSSAVVGVERPLNPGRHRIEATVPDGRRAETSIELGEGSRASVRLELGPTPAAVLEPAAPAQGQGSPTLAWFFGAGLGVALPVGNIAKEPDFPMSDSMGVGAALELRGGLRFARYLGVKLFVEGAGYRAANPRRVEFGQLGLGAGSDEQAEIKPTVTSAAFGFSVLAGSAPRRLGGFGEIGLVLAQRFDLKRELSFESTDCGGNAVQTLILTGGALRVGGGVFIPISPSFQLVPTVSGSFGRFTGASLKSDCNDLPPPVGLEDVDAARRRATHGVILLGVSGELLFGVK
jgi:hypothetical protein